MNTSSNRWREVLKTWRTGVESTWSTGGRLSCGAHRTSPWTTRRKVGFILVGAVVSRMFAHFHLHSFTLVEGWLKQWMWTFPSFYFENIKRFWAFKMSNKNRKSVQPNLSEDLVSKWTRAPSPSSSICSPFAFSFWFSLVIIVMCGAGNGLFQDGSFQDGSF